MLVRLVCLRCISISLMFVYIEFYCGCLYFMSNNVDVYVFVYLGRLMRIQTKLRLNQLIFLVIFSANNFEVNWLHQSVSLFLAIAIPRPILLCATMTISRKNISIEDETTFFRGFCYSHSL